MRELVQEQKHRQEENDTKSDRSIASKHMLVNKRESQRLGVVRAHIANNECWSSFQYTKASDQTRIFHSRVQHQRNEIRGLTLLIGRDCSTKAGKVSTTFCKIEGSVGIRHNVGRLAKLEMLYRRAKSPHYRQCLPQLENWRSSRKGRRNSRGVGCRGKTKSPASNLAGLGLRIKAVRPGLG